MYVPKVRLLLPLQREEAEKNLSANADQFTDYRLIASGLKR